MYFPGNILNFYVIYNLAAYKLFSLVDNGVVCPGCSFLYMGVLRGSVAVYCVNKF